MGCFRGCVRVGLHCSGHTRWSKLVVPVAVVATCCGIAKYVFAQNTTQRKQHAGKTIYCCKHVVAVDYLHPPSPVINMVRVAVPLITGRGATTLPKILALSVWDAT